MSTNNLTLKNVKIQNKLKTLKEWAFDTPGWTNIIPLSGETYFFAITGEELTFGDGSVILDTIYTQLPIGIYSKTGNGTTTLYELPWDHNIKGFITDIVNIDAKAEEAQNGLADKLDKAGGEIAGDLTFSKNTNWLIPYLVSFKNAAPSINPENPYTGFYQWGDQWQVNARDAENNFKYNLFTIDNKTKQATFYNKIPQIIYDDTTTDTLATASALDAVDGKVNAKADASTVTSLSSNVSTNITNISNLTTAVTNAQSAIDTLSQDMTSHTNHTAIDINNKVTLTYENGALRFKFN